MLLRGLVRHGLVLAVLAALAAGLLGVSSTAWAHASLVTSMPEDGVTVSPSPPVVGLRFSEPVRPVVIRLVGPDGQATDIAPRTRGEHVEVPLPALADGGYLLNWRVVSADGHPVAGTVSFSVGAGGAQRGAAVQVADGGLRAAIWTARAPLCVGLLFSVGSAVSAAVQVADGGLRAAIWTARTLLYVGLLFGVGSVFSLAWLTPAVPVGAWPRRLAAVALVLGFVGAVAGFGLAGIDLLGVDPVALIGTAPWQAAADTTLGQSLVLTLGAFVAAASAWWDMEGLPTPSLAPPVPASGPAVAAPRPAADPREARPDRRTPFPLRSLCAFTVVLAAAGLAATGHASTASPEWLARTALALHGACAMLWAGALPSLLYLCGADRRALAPSLLRFSRVALVAVVALAAAGGALVALQLRSPADLLDTAYGRLLTAKLAAVLVLLGLAAWNRLALTPRIAAGDRAAGRALARTVFVEITAMLVIAGLVAGWRFTPPPRALADARPEGAARVHVHGARAMADVAFLPGTTGVNRADIVVLGPDFDTLAAREVTLTLGNPAAGIEAIERRAVVQPDGRWQATGLAMPVAGRWTIRVDVLIDDFDKVILEDAFTLPR
jgi:copper transport protein